MLTPHPQKNNLLLESLPYLKISIIFTELFNLDSFNIC